MNLKRILLLTLGSFIPIAIGILSSCHRSQPSWDTNLLAPVVNTSLSINNLLTSGNLQTNPDSSVTLVYSDSLYNLNLDTLVHIPDTTLNYDYVSPFNTTIQPGGVMVPSNPTSTLYGIGSVQLTKAIIQSGYLNVYVKNTLSQKTDYFYSVPNVTLNNVPLQVFVQLAAGESLTEQIPLNGYSVDFTGPNRNSYNTITTNLAVNLDASSSALAVVPNDTVGYARITFTNIVPYFAKGYFGTTTKTFTGSAAFPLFNKIVAGILNLQNVNVSLTLQNGFGVDARITLSQLTSKNNRTPPPINLNDMQIINTAINVNRAVQTNNSPPASPVNASSQVFTINPSNSNILNWIDNLPDSVTYQVQVVTDPLGNVSGSNDFAYYGYGIKSYLNITVPLSLIATNLTLVDTVAVNFTGSGNAQQVKSGTLTIYAINGFPFSAGMQMYLLNNANKVTDSLFIPQQTIAAGIMNPSGVVVTPQNSSLTISLNAARTQELLKTKKAVILTKFNMGCISCLPPQYRKIYSFYRLSLNVVGNINYEIN